MTTTSKIDNIKNNNWFHFCSQIYWIKRFRKMINIFWLFLIYSIYHRFQRICCWKKSIHSRKINIDIEFSRCWNLMNFIQCRSTNYNENYHCNCIWQRIQYKTIVFFLNNWNETNKIFVQNTIMNKLRSKKIIVFVAISFDITIILLNDELIVHVWFKAFENNDCRSNINSMRFMRFMRSTCRNYCTIIYSTISI